MNAMDHGVSYETVTLTA